MDELGPDLEQRLLDIEDQLARTTSALRIFIERTEARSSAFEADVLGRLTATSRDVDVAVARLKAAAAQLDAETLKTARRTTRRQRIESSAIALLAVSLMGMGAWALRLQRRAVPPPAAIATPPGTAAADEITQANDTAVRAETLGDVLAAPDVVRFDLRGTRAAPRASGQLRWSRSRGLVFTAQGLPPPPPNTVYEIWLLTTGNPVSVGMAVPDETGRSIVMTDGLATTPPVTGVTVTLEPASGSAAPSGVSFLSAR